MCDAAGDEGAGALGISACGTTTGAGAVTGALAGGAETDAVAEPFDLRGGTSGSGGETGWAGLVSARPGTFECLNGVTAAIAGAGGFSGAGAASFFGTGGVSAGGGGAIAPCAAGGFFRGFPMMTVASGSGPLILALRTRLPPRFAIPTLWPKKR